MTNYVETPPQWNAIKWDGTNIADFQTLASTYLSSWQGTYLTPDGENVLIVWSGGTLMLTAFEPWLMHRPGDDGLHLVVCVDDSGSPVGFTEV